MVAPATRSTAGCEGRKGKDKVPKLKHGHHEIGEALLFLDIIGEIT